MKKDIELAELFDKARRLRSRESLYTSDELAQLVVSDSDKIYTKLKLKPKWRIIMTISSVILSALLTLWFIPDKPQHKQLDVQIEQQETVEESAATAITLSNENIKHQNNIEDENSNFANSDTIPENESYEIKLVSKAPESNNKISTKLKIGTIDVDIPGIMILSLTREELEKLNIRFDNKQIYFELEYFEKIHPIIYRRNEEYRKNFKIIPLVEAGYNTTGKSFLVKEKRIIFLNDPDMKRKYQFVESEKKSKIQEGLGGYSKKSKWEGIEVFENYELPFGKGEIRKYTGWNIKDCNRISPVWYNYSVPSIDKNIIISVLNNPVFQEDYFENLYTTAYYDFPKLIPLSIKFKDYGLDITKLNIPEIIFWFAPTEEFINALPERYSETLRKELEVIKAIDNGTKTKEEACKGYEFKETFFNICVESSNVIHEANVSPNPTIGFATIKFRLNEPRKVRLLLHTSAGKYIRDIESETQRAAGEFEVGLDLSNEPKDIYLISIVTNRGEKSLLRVIKK